MDYEQKRGLAKWRVEILSYLKVAKSEDINYILTYIRKDSEVVYLELLDMITELNREKTQPKSKKYSLINLTERFCYKLIKWLETLKGENKNEEICTINSICVGGGCYVDEYSEPN